MAGERGGAPGGSAWRGHGGRVVRGAGGGAGRGARGGGVARARGGDGGPWRVAWREQGDMVGARDRDRGAWRGHDLDGGRFVRGAGGGAGGGGGDGRQETGSGTRVGARGDRVLNLAAHRAHAEFQRRRMS